MAAAIVPFIPLIVSAAPSIVHFVEGLFGPKTGKQKMATATSLLQVVAQDLASAGKIPGAPDLTTLQNVLEMSVQILKGQGQLPAPEATASPIVGTPLTKEEFQQTIAAMKISFGA